MTNLPDINLLTSRQIEDILKTCDSYLGKKLGLEGAIENTKFPITISSLNLAWNSADGFEKDINLLTKENNIRSAYSTLYKNWEQKLAEEKSGKAEKTTLSKEEFKPLEEQAEKQKQLRAKATAKSQKDVEQFIKQQKAITEEAKKAKETLKDKKVYVNVVQPEPAKLTADEQKAFNNLRSMAQKTPHTLVENITKTIEDKLPEILKESAAPEEIHYYAETVAVKAVDNLRAGPKPVDKDPVVLASLSNHPEILDKLSVSEADKKFIAKASSDLATLKMLPYRANQQILTSVFGKNVTEQILGPDPTSFNVTFTKEPQESTDTVSLDKLAENYQSIAESPFFSQVQSFAVDEVKSKLLDFGKEKVLGQISKLPADSFLGKIAASEKFSGIINLLKPAQTIEATNLFGKLVMNFSPEFAPIVSGIGKLIGVDFGFISVPTTIAVTPIIVPIEAIAIEGVATTTPIVTTAAGEVAKKGIGTTISTAVLKGASSLAAKVGLSGLSAKLGAMIGTPLGGFVGAAIGAFIGWVVGKLLEPVFVWIKKHQEDLKILGLVMLGGGALVNSIPVIVIGGLIFIPTALKTGFSLARIASRTAFIFGRIGASMAITIATPIIVVLVVFPILVAIILFIINSGAYIVPPQGGYTRGTISCSQAIADRAKAIVDNLQPGFWGYFNKSPDYPELFDDALFAQNPDLVGIDTHKVFVNMFWCTWLVVKSYSENGYPVSDDLLFMTNLVNFFRGEGHYIDAAAITIQDVCPGMAVFFNVAGSSSPNHVGIVYSVSPDGFTTVESNAPWKTMFYPADSSGHFQIVGSGSGTIEVSGFGTP